MTIDLKGKTIVFTGTLAAMPRNEAKGIAYKLGARVSDSMGINVDYLIVGDKSGSKLGQANRYGVNIIEENDWYRIIGDIRADDRSISVNKIQKVELKSVLSRISEKKTIPSKVKNDFPELDLD